MASYLIYPTAYPPHSLPGSRPTLIKRATSILIYTRPSHTLSASSNTIPCSAILLGITKSLKTDRSAYCNTAWCPTFGNHRYSTEHYQAAATDRWYAF